MSLAQTLYAIKVKLSRITKESTANIMKRSLLSTAALLLLSLPILSIHNAQAEDKGLTIAKEQKARDTGWVDSQSEMKMILRAPNGKESSRIIKIKSLEVLTDGDKSLMVFDEPKDVQGTAFLSFSHVNTADDQWIYLPALKRVKRIASKKKSGSFMGSEFSYEDLASFEIDKYTFKYLRDEEFNGKKCWVVESFPKDSYSGYSRLVSWIDQQEYLMQKADFYDKKQTLLKTLTIKNYIQIDNKHWRPTLSSMKNHQTGKSTDLVWENIRLKTGLTDEDFSQNNLKRTN